MQRRKPATPTSTATANNRQSPLTVPATYGSWTDDTTVASTTPPRWHCTAYTEGWTPGSPCLSRYEAPRGALPRVYDLSGVGVTLPGACCPLAASSSTAALRS
jgi:hypothetical protein